jgi:hypothetical protein
MPRIEGTQIPTNTPDDLSTKNHKYTENKSDISTAIRIKKSDILNI